MATVNLTQSNPTTMKQLDILQYLIERHFVADSATINTAFALLQQIRQQLEKQEQEKLNN
jgi:hypothetical protein